MKKQAIKQAAPLDNENDIVEYNENLELAKEDARFFLNDFERKNIFKLN